MGSWLSAPSASQPSSSPKQDEKNDTNKQAHPGLGPALAASVDPRIPLRHRPTTLSSSFDISPVEGASDPQNVGE